MWTVAKPTQTKYAGRQSRDIINTVVAQMRLMISKANANDAVVA